ncbi:alpha/beta fold hydrolase [Calothrix sp. 336/3]|uniref:alpha/beta fold hydrolase n=1 Tax=Calothrix sp. 336/3 TaxID=1337936 RepID=UPI0011874CEF|nr:alpha/beta hydrolase [Calothrix sp. 336/3]
MTKPCFLTPKRMQPEYPLFIYLPGMDGTGQLLRSQTGGLEVGFDVRCLAIPRDDLTSWENLAASTLELIDGELDRNPHREVYLCGESFGGCLAQLVATIAPKLFDKVILINPASSFHLRSWYEWGAQLIYFTPSFLFDIGALGLLPFLAELSRMTGSDRQELLKTMRSVPPQTVLWRLSLIREFQLAANKLQQVTQPVLLIASGGDKLLPSVAEGQRLASIFPDARMVVLPHSGHACLLETDINLYEILTQENFIQGVFQKCTSLEASN